MRFRADPGSTASNDPWDYRDARSVARVKNGLPREYFIDGIDPQVDARAGRSSIMKARPNREVVLLEGMRWLLLYHRQAELATGD